MEVVMKTKKPASQTNKTKSDKAKPDDRDVSPVKEVDIMTEQKKKKTTKSTVENESPNKHHDQATEKSVDATSADFMEKMNEAVEIVDDVDKKLKADEKKAVDKLIQIKASELDALRHELDEAKDRGLRALAELENYRKRTTRSIQEDRKYASLDLARSILPVWDNMGRALEAAEKEMHPEAILDGLKMMYQQFLNIMKEHHVEEIDALHKPFDPNFHESIAQFPNAEFPPNTVIIVSQPGFKIHDRVVRPAQVVLSAPMPKKES